MIVVSNTSPLTNLAAIGQFDLLRELYDEIHIARSVWEELNTQGQRWPGCDEVAAADWIERHTVQNKALVTALQRDLDAGEAESIALALELKPTWFFWMREGQHAAQRMDLRVIGVVGVLLEAKASNAVNAIHPLLDGLRQSAGFYVSESLYQHA